MHEREHGAREGTCCTRGRISASLAESSREKWMEAVGKADRRTNPSRFWRLLGCLSGKRSASSAPNQPIEFKGKVLTKKRSIANGFIKQYTNLKPYKPSKEARKVIRDIKFNNPLDVEWTPFNETQVVEAIKASKPSPAAGPAGLTMLHLKHLGPLGIRYLTHLFNLSVNHADVPAIWKTANVIPILKPKKPADQGPSFRPISLLEPEIKILERLILPFLDQSLGAANSQHGFRRQRSTVTALLPLVTKIARGFNEPKPATRTGLLSVDLSKAFDMVDHHRLLKKIGVTDLHSNLKRWTISYLRDRKARCLYQGAQSRTKKVKYGIPQGAVTSPKFFNFFVNDIEAPSVETNESLADDFHGATHKVKPAEIAESLSNAAEEFASQVEDHGMFLSAPKSTVTLFTP